MKQFVWFFFKAYLTTSALTSCHNYMTDFNVMSCFFLAFIHACGFRVSSATCPALRVIIIIGQKSKSFKSTSISGSEM